MRKVLLSLLVAVVMIGVALPLTGCFGPSVSYLDNGTYTLNRTYLGDTRLTQGTEFDQVRDVTWRVEGRYIFVTNPVIPITDWQIRHRIVDGYLEQRELVSGSQWIRENGSAASGFVSTRVENGEIVMRLSVPGQPVWASFFSL